MVTHRVNVVLDDESYKSMKKDRPFTTSALIRFWLKVLIYSEDRLYKMKKEDEEFRAIMLYLAPKLQALVSNVRDQVKELNKP